MGDARTRATSTTVLIRPPGWFDVAEVVGDRTLCEIEDLRTELERLFRLAHAVGERWRAASAAVDLCVAATLAQGGRASNGFDASFADWTQAASGLAHLSQLGALVARQLDGSYDALDLRDQSLVRSLLDGGACA